MKKVVWSLLAGLIVLAAAGAGYGGNGSTSVNLQVTVVPRFSYVVSGEPATLTITEADAASGAKTVARGAVVSVDTNVPNGFILGVQAIKSGVFTSVRVQVKGGPSFEVPRAGYREVHLPFTGANPEVKELDFHFVLSPGVLPGPYPWPLAVSAHPV
ncbi:MAG: hypothetical protein ACE5EI_03380 [Thermodesulfobacteriota bacterium]